MLVCFVNKVLEQIAAANTIHSIWGIRGFQPMFERLEPGRLLVRRRRLIHWHHQLQIMIHRNEMSRKHLAVAVTAVVAHIHQTMTKIVTLIALQNH